MTHIPSSGANLFVLLTRDIAEAVATPSRQSVLNWVGANNVGGSLPHQADGRTHRYRLSDVVTRLRSGNGWGKRGGIHGDALHRLVEIDRERRGPVQADIWLDDEDGARAAALRSVLTEAERIRDGFIRGQLARGLVASDWSNICPERIRELQDVSILHPACLRYALSHDASELPKEGHTHAWCSFATAMAFTNCTPVEEIENEHKEAA